MRVVIKLILTRLLIIVLALVDEMGRTRLTYGKNIRAIASLGSISVSDYPESSISTSEDIRLRWVIKDGKIRWEIGQAISQFTSYPYG